MKRTQQRTVTGGAQRRPMVVAYDIQDDRTRRRVCRILLEWRLDGQYSLHECLLTAAEARELFIQLGQTIDPATDRLLLAWLAPGRALHARGVARADGVLASVLHVR